MMWLSCGLGKNKESSALDLKITSASQASLAGVSAEEGGFGQQLGACGAAFRARYNIALNPDVRQRLAASRHVARAC
jgi:hypothetical protein